MQRRVTLLSTVLPRTVRTALAVMAFACIGSVLASLAVAQETRTPTVLPQPEPPFRGKVGRNVGESTPDFPKEVEAPRGAPNVLLIMTDDVGFGASSTFGGPIPTPTMDAVWSEY